jgi:hypothetical protein
MNQMKKIPVIAEINLPIRFPFTFMLLMLYVLYDNMSRLTFVWSIVVLCIYFIGFAFIATRYVLRVLRVEREVDMFDFANIKNRSVKRDRTDTKDVGKATVDVSRLI